MHKYPHGDRGQKLQLDGCMIDGKGPSLVLGHPLVFHQGWLINLRNKWLLELIEELVAKGEDKTKEDEGKLRADASPSTSQLSLPKLCMTHLEMSSPESVPQFLSLNGTSLCQNTG